MKRNTVLKQQHVKRKRAGRYSELWRKACSVGAWCLKITVLLTGLAGISVLFVVLYSYLLTSPHIRLERVEIVGADEGMKKELQEMSGLNFELSLLAIDVDEVQRKLEKHPWIRAVEVEKQFPHELVHPRREGRAQCPRGCGKALLHEPVRERCSKRWVRRRL